jgi:hypothetical protein
MTRQIKVGVEKGGGPAPGYRWTVRILEIGYDDAMGFLTVDQYQHMAMQVKDLAREQDPTHPAALSVDAVEDFHELRDSGGVLGGLNVRVFFFLDKPDNLVILGAIKKQNNGPTPLGDKKRMSRRKRKYLNGDYASP